MDLIKLIRDAGVVGAGGAGFPADKKLDCNAQVFIVNGIECEPLLRTDRHAIELNAEKLVKTVKIIKENIKAQRAVIAVKRHYKEAVKALENAASDGVEIFLSDAFYPAGDEQNLVFSVTGRVVPTGGIPLDVGCVVSNVSTVLNIADAIEGNPVIQKWVTVSGCVKRPVTVSVPIGTPLFRLLEAAGGCIDDCGFIIGGPLMGAVTYNLNQPVTKTTGALLAFPKEHKIFSYKTVNEKDRQIARAVCCQCSFCTQLCPRNAMGLNVEPHKAMRAFASGNEALLGAVNGVFSCCDCGLCTYYACNFGLKPSKAMQQEKQRLNKEGIRPVKEVRYNADKGFDNKKVPTQRLMQRLDLDKYENDAPFIGCIESETVDIPLKMHIGAPSKPIVKKGSKVKKGDLIAQADGLGANIHASINGTVTYVGEDHIEIKG